MKQKQINNKIKINLDGKRLRNFKGIKITRFEKKLGNKTKNYISRYSTQ